jgi:hypothetical protein
MLPPVTRRAPTPDAEGRGVDAAESADPVCVAYRFAEPETPKAVR